MPCSGQSKRAGTSVPAGGPRSRCPGLRSLHRLCGGTLRARGIAPVLTSVFTCPGPPQVPRPPIETLVVGSTPHGATVSSFVTPAETFCVSSGVWVRLLEASPWPSTAVLCAPAMPLPSACQPAAGPGFSPPGPTDGDVWRAGVELLHTEPLTGLGPHHPSCPEAPGGGGGAPFGEWLLLDPASRRSWPR